MKAWVLDAGVAAKWYIASEPLSNEAVEVFQKFEKGEIELVVPDLFWPEFGNVMWKAVRQDRIKPADVERAITSLGGEIIPTAPTKPLLNDAFALATAHGRTVYDCVYVTLAIQRGCELLTADERMVNALGSRYPVRWLGSFIH